MLIVTCLFPVCLLIVAILCVLLGLFSLPCVGVLVCCFVGLALVLVGACVCFVLAFGLDWFLVMTGVWI